MIRKLIAAGANPNLNDTKLGISPLAMAMRAGQLKAGEALLEGGADPDAMVDSSKGLPL